jgi:hypothetical protein
MPGGEATAVPDGERRAAARKVNDSRHSATPERERRDRRREIFGAAGIFSHACAGARAMRDARIEKSGAK